MTRIRLQKPKKTRKRAPSPAPLEDITSSSPARSLLAALEELLEDIDQALEETGGWPG